MIATLVAALRALDPEVTAEEVADVLWLGAWMPASTILRSISSGIGSGFRRRIERRE